MSLSKESHVEILKDSGEQKSGGSSNSSTSSTSTTSANSLRAEVDRRLKQVAINTTCVGCHAVDLPPHRIISVLNHPGLGFTSAGFCHTCKPPTDFKCEFNPNKHVVTMFHGCTYDRNRGQVAYRFQVPVPLGSVPGVPSARGYPDPMVDIGIEAKHIFLLVSPQSIHWLLMSPDCADVEINEQSVVDCIRLKSVQGPLTPPLVRAMMDARSTRPPYNWSLPEEEEVVNWSENRNKPNTRRVFG